MIVMRPQVTISNTPARRESETSKVVIYGTKACNLYLTSSLDTRGAAPRLQEIFCSVEKTGSDERAYMDTIARLSSKLLAYVPVDEVASMLEGVVTSVRGPVKSPHGVKFCFGYIDLLGRELLAMEQELRDVSTVR